MTATTPEEKNGTDNSNPKSSPENQRGITLNNSINRKNPMPVQEERCCWNGTKGIVMTETRSTMTTDSKNENQSILVKSNSRSTKKVTQSFNNTNNNIQTQQQTFEMMG
jgi:hypothetical protein